MHLDPSPPVFRDRDADVTPVTHISRAEDVLATMLQAIEGGLHLWPTFTPEAESPFNVYLEIGVALRRCAHDKTRHAALAERLKPYRGIIPGILPPGIQPHGMLPLPGSEAAQLLKHRELEDITDAELRQWVVDDCRLVYGEFKPYELDNYFDAIAPHLRPGGEMIDLGSGLGKVVMLAALKLPFARCTGVELLAYRHHMAQERLEKVLAAGDQALAALPAPLQPDTPLTLPSGTVTTAAHLLNIRSRIHLAEQDMFQADVRNASLVFIYSTCFESLMDALGDKLARELPQHALVSTTSYRLRHPGFRLIKEFPAKTVAWTAVFIHERIGALDTLPAATPGTLYESDEAEWVKQALALLQQIEATAAG